ncbi:unnamed protein product [Ranitomeya imitator]|uniref:SCAN box domain-containing protein n=1 Tax=Ranitomeya imitator TaxID=111125 RepID=A0ABN9L6P4_9NEOB|nr:unnamed protein product [Ranitomeya imitator]
MSWLKAPVLLKSQESSNMEELVKQLLQANVQQQQTNTYFQQALDQQNQIQQEQLNAIKQALVRQPRDEEDRAQSAASARKAVQKTLLKMTADDDVEAYLTVFERIAEREHLPVDRWAEVVAPFLSGDPQKAYYDLSGVDAMDYTKLKGEILARLGVNTYVRAQRVHVWTFVEHQPARSQMHDLIHLVKKWLQPETLTSAQMLERVVLDKYLRSLPAKLQGWVGQGNPSTADQLVNMVKRYNASESLLHGTLSPRWDPKKSPENPAKAVSSSKEENVAMKGS